MLSTGVDMYARRREIRAGSEIFSVRGFEEIVAPDGTCRVLRADARQGSVRAREVRLVRLDVLRGGVGADQWRAGLKAEARLHDEVAGLPRVVFRFEERDALTFATGMPPGVALTELYGRPPWSGRVLGDVLRGLVLVGRTLEGLHRTGRAHRALRPEVLLASRDRMWLRDAGLAAAPPEAGEGADAYRAPEQRRAVAGAATDVYQLAAIVYHLVTGEAPVTDPLPVSLLRPEWGRLDETLAAALHRDPGQRPTVAGLTGALSRLADRAA
ncbi:hypothetical protein [Actinoplanes sp. CA-252034]|uniref:hypothetical protein n=1 Tax=Actinoplanes sp. CA-252034 TaxID=3239906 RepID=UPI003D9647C7